MSEHHLKTTHDAWDAVERGDKTAEFRKDDRGFNVGDTLVLFRTTLPLENLPRGFPRLNYVITHIVRGPDYGIPVGYTMLSLSAEKEHKT